LTLPLCLILPLFRDLETLVGHHVFPVAEFDASHGGCIGGEKGRFTYFEPRLIPAQ
jgi:hypothetical protein